MDKNKKDSNKKKQDIKYFKEYKYKKKNTNKRGFKKVIRNVFIIILFMGIMIGNLSIYQVSSSLKYKINYLKKDLEKNEVKLEELELQSQKNIDLKKLEKDAKDKLKMVYPTEDQKVYISVDD